MRLGAAKQPANHTIERSNDVVGQPCSRVEHGSNQGGLPPQGRQLAQLGGGETATHAGQLPEPFGMHAFGMRWIEADRPQAGQLFDQPQEGAMTGRARRSPGPGQHAHRGFFLHLQQGIDRFDLDGAQPLRELAGARCSASSTAAATMRSMTDGPGAMIWRCRNSSNSDVAMAGARVVASATYRRVECGQRRRLWFKPVIPQLRET
jgi:hypothetical protein